MMRRITAALLLALALVGLTGCRIAPAEQDDYPVTGPRPASATQDTAAGSLVAPTTPATPDPAAGSSAAVDSDGSTPVPLPRNLLGRDSTARVQLAAGEPTGLPAGDGDDPQAYYANCDDVRAAGMAPLARGDNGYRDALDRDQDGFACDVSESNTPRPSTSDSPQSTAVESTTDAPADEWRHDDQTDDEQAERAAERGDPGFNPPDPVSCEDDPHACGPDPDEE